MKHRFRMTGTALALSAALLVLSLPTRIWAVESGSPPVQGEEAGEGQEAQQTGEDGGEETSPSDEMQDQSWPVGPGIEGESGILMEVSTGTILYSKNIHAQYYPASITKILTSLLVIENCDMDEIVTIPHEAVYMDEDKGSHIALDEGEELTVKDCLYGVLLASANDAAYALAIHVSGSIEGFAALMNSRAQELGCTDSHFMNPHGLPNEQHLTSAYDMALITREALKHEVFREISGTVFYEIPPSEKQPDQIPLSNHHKMLTSGPYHYDGVFAGKPGYTVVAKNTLVTCAARDGMELICVTMKTQGKQVYVDTAALFDFGFDSFHKLDVGENLAGLASVRVHARTEGEKDGEPSLKRLPLKVAQDGCAVVPAQVTFADLDLDLYYDTQNAAPGEEALLECSYGGRPVGSTMIALAPPLTSPERTRPEDAQKAASRVEADEGTQGPERAEKPERAERKWELGWQYVVAGAALAAALAAAAFLAGRRMIWKNRWRRRSESFSSYSGFGFSSGHRRRRRRSGWRRRR